METFTRAIGNKTKHTVKEDTSTWTVQNIMVNGLTINKKATGRKHGQMVPVTRANMLVERNMEEENLNGLMVQSSKAISLIIT